MKTFAIAYLVLVVGVFLLKETDAQGRTFESQGIHEESLGRHEECGGIQEDYVFPNGGRRYTTPTLEVKEAHEFLKGRRSTTPTLEVKEAHEFLKGRRSTTPTLEVKEAHEFLKGRRSATPILEVKEAHEFLKMGNAERTLHEDGYYNEHVAEFARIQFRVVSW